MYARQAPTTQDMVLSISPTLPGVAVGTLLKRFHVGIPALSVQDYDHFRTRPSGKDTRKSMKSYIGVACAALRSQKMSKW